MRLFLAIFPPKSHLDYFRDVIRVFDKQKRNLKPIELEQVHLTVRFIGAKVSEASRQKLSKAFLKQQGNYPKPNISVHHISLGFPHQFKPYILIANINEDPGLEDLVETTHKIIRNEKREDTILWKQNLDKFYHVSLARLKDAAVNRSTITTVKEMVKNVNIEYPEPFQPEEMYLMESTIKSNGAPIYRKLERIRL